MSEALERQENPSVDTSSAQPSRHHGPIQAVAIESYIGPLPHPDILARFDQIVPGAAARIFDDFVSQSNHRRASERQIVHAEVFRQIVSSIASALIGIGGVSGGIWLVHEGRDVGGLTTLLATLASLAGVYLFQQRRNESD